MNIPNIPTDNLYKFLALAGTIIVFLSVYLAETRVAEVGIKVLEAQETVDIIAAKNESLTRKITKIEKIIENSIQQQSGRLIKDENKFEIEYTSSEIKELFKEIDKTTLLVQIEQAKSESKTKAINHLQKRSIQIFHRSIIAIIIGLVMANSGFYFWYIRVQKPLDKIMQNELSKSTSNE